MMPMPRTEPDDLDRSSGGRLVSTEGRELPLKSARIEARVRSSLAEVVLRQTFQNPHDEPLCVRYQLPLPADGAVGAMSFVVGGRRIEGEIESRRKARERFEQAVVAGRGAALLEEERSSLFTQELGNVPPGAEVVAEIGIDQPLAWLAEGRWAWRFPTVVAPRYLGAAGRVEDAGAVEVDVSDAPEPPPCSARLELVGERTRPSSTTHAIEVSSAGGSTVVTLEGALDRDVAVSWPAAAVDVGAQLVTARPGADHRRGGSAFGLLTIVPPAEPEPALSRNLVLLIDASGSMHGRPIAQARRLALALIEQLGEDDTLEMVSFASRPERWREGPARATEAHKRQASEWVEGLRAGGGTEMRSGILEALATVREEAQRQIVLVSDGLIGFEHEIVAAIAERLPRGSRLHTVGVGSAVNRTLTNSAARAGRGREIVIGVDDDVEPPIGRLMRCTSAPVVVDLEVDGDAIEGVAPARLPDLFAEAPAEVSLALAPGGGSLRVRGQTAGGRFERHLEVPPTEAGDGEMAVVRRFAREAVADLEVRGARGDGVDEAIERLGLDFRISSRMTSWIALSDAPTVDPTAPSRRETMPQALPHGMSMAALGLRGKTRERLRMIRPAAFAPPAAPASPAPPSEMVDEEVAEAELSEALGEEGIEPPARGRSADPPRPKPLSALTLPARIVVEQDDRLTFEVTLPRALAWKPERPRLHLSDGTAVEVTIDEGATTRAGRCGPGVVVRVSVLFGEPLGAEPTALELRSPLLSLTLQT